MQYIPKELTENVNVTKTHPLLDLATLVGGVALIIAILYLLLGFAAEMAATRIPVEAEVWIGERALDQFEGEQSQPLQKRLDALLLALPDDSPLHQYIFRIHLVETEDINAVALPGGNILVFAGLLDEVESENELLMVLAHELGHFAHRDHLKGLGRGLAVSFASLLIFGQDSGITSLVNDLSMSFEARYSREQEAEADQFGLDLLVQTNGHAGGATDFFARLSEESDNRFLYLLASHPHPEKRVEEIREQIADNGYAIRPTVALADDLFISAADETEASETTGEGHDKQN